LLTALAAFLADGAASLADGAADGAAAVAVQGQERLGQPVQRGRIDVPGDDRRDGGVAGGRIGVGAGQPARPVRRRGGPPRGLSLGGAREIA